jgi:hypothetical protein
MPLAPRMLIGPQCLPTKHPARREGSSTELAVPAYAQNGVGAAHTIAALAGSASAQTPVLARAKSVAK